MTPLVWKTFSLTYSQVLATIGGTKSPWQNPPASVYEQNAVDSLSNIASEWGYDGFDINLENLGSGATNFVEVWCNIIYTLKQVNVL